MAQHTVHYMAACDEKDVKAGPVELKRSLPWGARSWRCQVLWRECLLWKVYAHIHESSQKFQISLWFGLLHTFVFAVIRPLSAWWTGRHHPCSRPLSLIRVVLDGLGLLHQRSSPSLYLQICAIQTNRIKSNIEPTCKYMQITWIRCTLSSHFVLYLTIETFAWSSFQCHRGAFVDCSGSVMTSSNLMFIEITWKITCITLDQGDFDKRSRIFPSHASELETWKLPHGLARWWTK